VRSEGLGANQNNLRLFLVCSERKMLISIMLKVVTEACKGLKFSCQSYRKNRPERFVKGPSCLVWNAVVESAW
jgi:hypothetical protein